MICIEDIASIKLVFNMVDDAIAREKELKGWRREKKDRLITIVNPQMEELAEKLGWI